MVRGGDVCLAFILQSTGRDTHSYPVLTNYDNKLLKLLKYKKIMLSLYAAPVFFIRH